ncbi:MAG: hemerythrin domain-containing protein [Caulobacter sp.]|nr:hemerythrin domain-containing protein [Caulobacter sp.]
MRRSGPEMETLPLALLAEPLEWFFAEHYRHRQACRLMEHAAGTHVFDAELLVQLLDFVRNELAVHVIDEEEDLFPLLRRNALPEDDIERVLGLLSAEHRLDLNQAASLAEHLESCLNQKAAPGLVPTCRDTLRAFASQELRHLALENAVVLPIARLRLSPADIRGLSQRLAARRGVVLDELSP